MGQVWNLQQKSPLLLIERSRLLIKIDNLIADFSDLSFEFVCCITLRFLAADLFAQSFAVGL